MISQHIKLDGESLIAVMIPRETVEASEALHREISQYLVKRFHPHLAQWLDNEKIVEKVHACKTLEELEKLDVVLIYPSLFSDLAEQLDTEGRLSDTEKAFILTQVADSMIKGAQDWLTGLGHQRANAIASGGAAKQVISPVGGLFTPEGKKAREKKSRIIT